MDVPYFYRRASYRPGLGWSKTCPPPWPGSWPAWREILYCAVISFGRVLAAVALGTLWTVPVGIWIGLNPRLASRLQPFIQFAASFPAPMLYPWIVALLFLVGSTLQWGAIILILLGTQWYILFNVTASAAAIPNDIVSCATLLRLDRWRQWTRFLLPAIFPGLVTGWVTAAGGAWNATIVSEYVHYPRQVIRGYRSRRAHPTGH